MELDTIAAVVIGGTLLTGGVGNILGTVLGVLVYGIIQVLIVFQGTLNSWWTRIVIGFLVFVFCILQRLFEARKGIRISQSVTRQSVPVPIGK
jgi:simple sugar transport system permease protein